MIIYKYSQYEVLIRLHFANKNMSYTYFLVMYILDGVLERLHLIEKEESINSIYVLAKYHLEKRRFCNKHSWSINEIFID